MTLPLGFHTTAEEAVELFKDGIKGKNIIVTGTSLGGLGFETARVLTKYANLVVVTGRDAGRLQLTVDALKKDNPAANVRPLTLDLGSLDATRKAAAEVNAYSEPIHVLINNAASNIGAYKLSKEGVESQFSTNHLAPFIFTNLIIPKLLATKTDTFTPRVVNVASGAHHFGTGIRWDDVNFSEGKEYGPYPGYAQSKSANILYSIELSRRLKGKLVSYSLHPGVIWTNINKDSNHDEMKALGLLDAEGNPIDGQFQWKTMGEGASTTITAAFDPSLLATPGAYLDDNKDATSTLAEHSSKPELAEKLWPWTEKLIGEKFDI